MGKMKQSMGVWLPSHEQHMVEWVARRMRERPEEVVDGKGTYQYHKLLAAMKFVKRFRVAVDIGAHVGFWSMHLVKRFEHVHAFEPIGLHRDCFALNVVPLNKTTMHPIALGDHSGTVEMKTTEGSSGDSKVSTDGGAYTLKRLDDVIDIASIDYDRVDFVKVDAEGYEMFILRGGEQLLRRCKPTVIVEQKPGFARRYGLPQQGAVDYLQSLGAVLRKEIGGDFILSWDLEKVEDENRTQDNVPQLNAGTRGSSETTE
jgi:FkbM family methyltransferase